MPTLSNYRYFIEIARDMNLEQTASRMYITHQGLSGHLRRLESHYGVKLVTSTPEFSLTEDGKWLLQQAKKIVNIENEIIDYFEHTVDDTEQVIRVACRYPRIRNLVFEAMSKLKEHYPNVDIQIIKLDEDERLPEDAGAIDLFISNRSAAPENTISRELLPNYGYLIASRKFLRRTLGENINLLLEKIDDGIALSDFPRIDKIAAPGRDDKKWWVASFFPEIKNIEIINVSGERPEETLKLCSSGQCVMITSQLYWDNVERVYSKSFLGDLYVFPLLKNGKRVCRPEYISWPKDMRSRPNGKMTGDLIRIIESKLNKGVI